MKTVVSVDNQPYLAWQSLLFHYSAQTYAGLSPTFFVHTQDDRLHDHYRRIIDHGGAVHMVPPEVRTFGGREYPPRNFAATCLFAASLYPAHDLALFDPDMIFTHPPILTPGSAEACPYLDYQEERIRSAARRCGADPAECAKVQVPYVIPAGVADTIGYEWMDAIDTLGGENWIDSMYAFGLASAGLQHFAATKQSASNVDPDAIVTEPIIHYCYGDARWNKRTFRGDQAERVWSPIAGAQPGSVLSRLSKQIIECKEIHQL